MLGALAEPCPKVEAQNWENGGGPDDQGETGVRRLGPGTRADQLPEGAPLWSLVSVGITAGLRAGQRAGRRGRGRGPRLHTGLLGPDVQVTAPLSLLLLQAPPPPEAHSGVDPTAIGHPRS